MLDAKWLELFKLPLRTAIAVAIASCALLALVFTHILDLGPIGLFALPVLIIAAVVSTAMAVVGSVDALLAPFREKRKQSALELRRAVRRKEQDEQREQAEGTAIGQLDHLSKEEIAVVAKALRAGSPTFYTYVFSPPVSMLQGKGLVWTTGGTHHQDHYPFSFYSFAWKVLLERKDEFIAKDEAHKRAEEERKRAERQSRRY
ncbi:stage II sporulation protein M [Burkholderia cenocepacia]|uniref:stage II sporulation protein M n=1 Tax=Burkholderia cenocepacia TaxID=95486 RepID=UPI0020124AF4|nr:stage II sporulation protein M [Burkholderia cenocepacia]